MGRHGGGSRSGGSHHSSHSSHGGGSRSGGSGSSSSVSNIRISTTPFLGCYNRSYYDRHGVYHQCYTSDKSYGKQSAGTLEIIVTFVIILIFAMLVTGAPGSSFIRHGGKVSGDRSRIYIEDTADVLTPEEETEVLSLFEKVYDKTGMPITLYTDDFSWKEHYRSLEVYSEELYYQIGYEEDALIILFTTNGDEDFYDWEYDVYCGDDTEKCFSDEAFDDFLDAFQKGMAGQKLAEALDYGWNSVYHELAKTTIDGARLLATVMVFLIYSGMVAIVYLGTMRKDKARREARRYFRQHPEAMSDKPMSVYNECPNCGAPNSAQKEVCEYCGSVLKMTR